VSPLRFEGSPSLGQPNFGMKSFKPSAGEKILIGDEFNPKIPAVTSSF